MNAEHIERGVNESNRPSTPANGKDKGVHGSEHTSEGHLSVDHSFKETAGTLAAHQKFLQKNKIQEAYLTAYNQRYGIEQIRNLEQSRSGGCDLVAVGDTRSLES